MLCEIYNEYNDEGGGEGGGEGSGMQGQKIKTMMWGTKKLRQSVIT